MWWGGGGPPGCRGRPAWAFGLCCGFCGLLRVAGRGMSACELWGPGDARLMGAGALDIPGRGFTGFPDCVWLPAAGRCLRGISGRGWVRTALSRGYG